ncbi:MAG: hypothetical protein JW779_13085 [Candidatus Thorarchaeota archaeon]|nr:hypothetical protein [Candidatus Thorarchaeota archaeon]
MTDSDERPDRTRCQVTYPMVSALLKAEEFLRNTDGLVPTNDTQKIFIKEFYNSCKSDIPKIHEIESIADTNIKKINNWLKERGFSIQLSSISEGGFGIASMLDLLGKWAKNGEKWSVSTEDGNYYPGIKMTNYGLGFYRVEGNQNIIIEIETKASDKVFLLMADHAPAGLSLVKHVEDISREMRKIEPEYEGVVFPMIDLNEEGVLKWLIGLNVGGMVVAEALQQTKLKMNHEGFRVKSAVAMGILKAPPRRGEPYVINRPFLMWITRPGLSKPLFVAYLNKDVWKNPEGLDM